MKLRLPYPPTANFYWRKWRGRMVVSPEARAYRQAVKMRALAEGLKRPVTEGEVCLSVAVFRPHLKGDLGNRLKIMEDALQGVAFDDDEQVGELHAIRFLDRADPRIEVRVEPISDKRRRVCHGCDDPTCFHCGGVIR